MNKIINKSIIFIGIIMLLSIFNMSAMAGDIPKIVIDGPVVVAPNEEVTLTVKVSGADIIGAQAQIYIDKRFFDVISIEDIDNEGWNISHSSAEAISVLSYSNDLSSQNDISLLNIKVKSKSYILKGDRITMTITNPKIVSREFADTIAMGAGSQYTYVGELPDKRGWDNHKQLIKSSKDTVIELYMYGEDELPKWVLNTAVKNNLTMNVHMADYDFIINPALLKEENKQEDSYNMNVTVDYNAHKYAENQLAVISFDGNNNFPGNVDYSIFMPKAIQSDTNKDNNILIYKIGNTTSEYEFLGQYTVDDNQNINLTVSEFGKYIAAVSEIEGDLHLPYQQIEKEIEPEISVEEIGYGLAVIGIILVIIALFWFSAIMAVRAVRRRIYRDKINKRTLELIMEDEVDEAISSAEKIVDETNSNEPIADIIMGESSDSDDTQIGEDDIEIDNEDIISASDTKKKKKRKLFKKKKH